MSIGKRSEQIYLSNHKLWLLDQHLFKFPRYIHNVQIGDPTQKQLSIPFTRNTKYNFRVQDYDGHIYYSRVTKDNKVLSVEPSEWWRSTMEKVAKYSFSVPTLIDDIRELIENIIRLGGFKTQPRFYRVENGILPPDPRVLLGIKEDIAHSNLVNSPSDDIFVYALRDLFGGSI